MFMANWEQKLRWNLELMYQQQMSLQLVWMLGLLSGKK